MRTEIAGAIPTAPADFRSTAQLLNCLGTAWGSRAMKSGRKSWSSTRIQRHLAKFVLTSQERPASSDQPMAPRTIAREPKDRGKKRDRRAPAPTEHLSVLMTVPNVADLLHTSASAVYSLVARHQIPGVRRIGRRVLFHRAELLAWLDHTCASSAKGDGR